jgi:hypothetical protein
MMVMKHAPISRVNATFHTLQIPDWPVNNKVLASQSHPFSPFLHMMVMKHAPEKYAALAATLAMEKQTTPTTPTTTTTMTSMEEMKTAMTQRHLLGVGPKAGCPLPKVSSVCSCSMAFFRVAPWRATKTKLTLDYYATPFHLRFNRSRRTATATFSVLLAEAQTATAAWIGEAPIATTPMLLFTPGVRCVQRGWMRVPTTIATACMGR